MNIQYPPSSLTGIEVLSCCGGHQFGKHIHDGYVLWLNSCTGEEYTVNGNSSILVPGSISIIEPGVVHSNRSCGEGESHLRSCYCSEEFFQSQYSRIYDDGYYAPLLSTREIEDPFLWQTLSSLHGLVLQKAESTLVDEYVLMALSRLFSACGGRFIRPLSELGDKRVALCIDYFHAHFGSSISLDELAAMTGCTTFHLIRLFRQKKGMSSHAYLTQIRLEKARRLLEEGCAISDVAALCGLSDQSHLTRSFKKRYGVTPGQYVQQRCSA